MAALSTFCVEFGFSLRTLLATLVPRVFLFFHDCTNRFNFCRDFFPLTFWSGVHPSVMGALSPATPCGLLGPGFRGTIPISALLTLDSSLFLSRDEHEDDRHTLCIVPELKEAASSDPSNHSSPLSSSSSSPEDDG